MIKKRAVGLAAFLLLTQPLASSASGLPEGVLQTGSLANQKLMNDAMVGVVGKVVTKGCEAPESFLPYVLRMPEGPVGQRAWAERWVVTGCGREFPIDVEFREDGAQGANWLVR